MKSIDYVISLLWYSGIDKARDTEKRSVVVRDWSRGMGLVTKGEQGIFEGQGEFDRTVFYIDCGSGYKTICQNS